MHMVSLDNMDIVGRILKPSYRYSARLALHDTMSDATRSSESVSQTRQGRLDEVVVGCSLQELRGV